MIRRPPRSTLSSSSAASDVYKRQVVLCPHRVWAVRLHGGVMSIEGDHRMSIRRDTDLAIVPLPSRPLAPGEPYPDSMVERSFELWSTCRNAEAVAEMLRQELGPEVTT